MILTKRDTTAAAPIPNAVHGDEAEGIASLYEDLLEAEPMPAELREELMPKHVAVIMDGNRRWAKMRGLPPSEGHVALVPPLRMVVKLCLSWGIKVLTVYAFSTENLLRPKVIINVLRTGPNRPVRPVGPGTGH
ncbi:dehydrodolichyl diphosphate synthase 2-like, partial [Trifolium medium]|nr:dehydrodolichyl diphosphate synthase 2-like [Trifolium medium]